ncbi:MAG: MFS transporter, partial [Gemmatimonadota bacterium]|nr:MFS transporter [Gemmatimonadota bacterium]
MTDAGAPRGAARRSLAVLSAAVLLGMSVWFAASAAAPHLAERWALDPSRAGWLATLVQLGFVAGTLAAAVLNLADVVPARRYFAASSAAAALANAALVVVPDYEWALVTRFFTGFFLAGVYPPAMKMAATWFVRGRGLAIGTLVGALTVGKAMPWLVDVAGGAGIGFIVLGTSAGGGLAALLVLAGYRDGPYAFPRRPFAWGLVGDVVRGRKWRLATGGYLGHMWELYAMWAWIATFLAASERARLGLPAGAPAGVPVKLAAFVAIAVGAAGCVWGGWVADREGYEPLTMRAMAASGTCALLVGLFFGASPLLLMPIVLAWGFFVIADSAQFSALVTEVVEPHAVGTALTLQVAAGFLL